MTILHIDSSILGENSVSRDLTATIVAEGAADIPASGRVGAAAEEEPPRRGSGGGYPIPNQLLN